MTKQQITRDPETPPEPGMVRKDLTREQFLILENASLKARLTQMEFASFQQNTAHQHRAHQDAVNNALRVLNNTVTTVLSDYPGARMGGALDFVWVPGMSDEKEAEDGPGPKIDLSLNGSPAINDDDDNDIPF